MRRQVLIHTMAWGGRCSGHSTSTAGGYLRLLTDKARVGDFSIGPMLMAAHKANDATAGMTG